MQFLKEKLNLRLYQQTILNSTVEKNTLVVLPTGLGKTQIAIGLAALRISQGRILMLAPTKPLVVQHYKVFSEYFSPKEEIGIVTGATKQEERDKTLQAAKIILATPQTIKHDLLSGKFSFRDFSLVVFDEAHRATGNYDYVFLAKEYASKASVPRILALTASPGSDAESVNKICTNLYIEKTEARDREHPEVKQYVKPLTTDFCFLELPEELQNIKKHLENAIKTRLEELKNLNFIQTSDIKKINKKSLLALQKNLQAQIAHGDFGPARALSLIAALVKLMHALGLAESESLAALKNYFENLWHAAEHSTTRAAKDIASDVQVRVAYSLALSALERGLEHPKLEKIKEIIEKQISENQKPKILVFSEYRDNIPKLIAALDEISGLNVQKFIGQASKKEAGMSQKTQIEVLEKFRAGEINCLVCTQVAEEGLDIPQVDLVVFYSPIPSVIRTVQRRGRTARQHVGRIAILITKNSRDEIYYWASRNKERKMNLLIQNLNETGEKRVQANAVVAPSREAAREVKSEKPELNLDTFIPKPEKKEEKILIFADAREQGPIVENLFSLGANVKIGTLKAGDFILSEDVGVERKIISDFVTSLLDGRLFEQAKKMKENFGKAILILEGSFPEIFSVRQVNPAAIWGAFASLVLDFNLNLLFSENPGQTAELLLAIAKREQLEKKKEFSVRLDIKPKTLVDMQQFFVEGLPAVGPTLARNLLKHFGSPAAVVNASLEELQKVEGIGNKKAEEIKRILETKWNVV